MRWLQLVRSIKLQVSFAKEPYKRGYILQKRPVILSILLTVAITYKMRISYRTFGTFMHLHVRSISILGNEHVIYI